MRGLKGVREGERGERAEKDRRRVYLRVGN